MFESLLEAYVTGLTSFWASAFRVHLPNILFVLLLIWFFCGRRGCRRHGRCRSRRHGCRCCCGGCCCGHRRHDDEEEDEPPKE